MLCIHIYFISKLGFAFEGVATGCILFMCIQCSWRHNYIPQLDVKLTIFKTKFKFRIKMLFIIKLQLSCVYDDNSEPYHSIGVE
jgi:hypothetical protein